MKLLHTADWHLGAYLGSFSRINEQKLFIDQLCAIVDKQSIDMVVVAGDIFDTANPSAAAEALFYDAMTRLAGRKIPIVLVAGNHDNVERLLAPAPMAAEMGIIVFATPHCVPPARDFEGFSVHPLGSCCTQIKRGNDDIVLAAMPFVSEKRLNEAIFTTKDEVGMQKDYSEKVRQLFAASADYFRPDAINIAAGHFHIAGGESSRGLERDIMLGGSFAVLPPAMPNAQCIAMGHLHRAQKIKCGIDMQNLAYYAGSPLQYSLSECGYVKGVYIADLAPGQPVNVEKLPLNCPKPIELWEVATAAEALEKCANGGNSYKYIKITGEAALNPADIKEMRKLAPDIVSIDIANDGGLEEIVSYEKLQILDARTEFIEFYTKNRGMPPKDEIIEIFNEILHDEEIL